MPKRLQFLFALLACLIVVAAVRMLTAPRYGPGHSVYLKSIAAAEAGDPAMAVHHMRRAVMAEPGNGDYHAELGNLYLQTREPDFALAELQAAAFLTPKRPHIYCQIAQAAVELRRRDEAMDALAEAERRSPDCSHALGVKAEQLLRDDNIKGALEAYQKLAQLSPEVVMAHQKCGYLLLQVNRPKEAIEALRKGLIMHPSDSGLHALLGEAYSRQSTDPDSAELAEKHLKRAIPNNPEAATAHAALGNLYLRRGNLPAARAELETVLSDPPPLPSALYGLAQVARREGKTAEAETLLKAYEKGRELVRQIADLEAAAGAGAGGAEAHKKLARSCLDLGLLNKAGRALDAAMKIDPADKETRNLRVTLFRSQGLSRRASAEMIIAASLRTKEKAPPGADR